MNHEVERQDYVEYSTLVTLTWGSMLASAVGWTLSVVAVVGSPPLLAETVEVGGETALFVSRVRPGALLSLAGVVLFSALFIKGLEVRGELDAHPGATWSGGEEA